MRIAAIVVAAGRGERAAGGLPKQFRPVWGRPVLEWPIIALEAAGVAPIVVVVATEHKERAAHVLAAYPSVRLVDGGATRTASVRAGLEAAGEADILLIHDAARPGLTKEMALSLIGEVKRGAHAVAPALPSTDALLRVSADGNAAEDVSRDGLMRVQTPQAFDATTLRHAYAKASHDRAFGDDLSVVRAAGVAVRLIAGDPRLMKITFPEDFAVIERLLAGERVTCVGNGVDAHRFGPGDHVTLCGVRIAHDKGLVGHSDADAGWHALVDAILGALGQGDIGAHFPPSDPQWKGADSERFLQHAVSMAQKQNARILHVDVTLLCERPKIGPHRETMRARTAEVLGIPFERVSVKATTTEKMGFLGREEGLAAQATATLDRLV
jgi:2-C-methyl-D-erythritol 4-phosphate cytidylyltransferase/2-C-methyl-D-erythritol 2,4-cyclodiphosphate synthase